MITLTPRLKAVADYVRHMGVVADIGTDHAYVPVFLAENNYIKKAYACDIGEGPLQNALKTINAENIQNVTCILSDGLNAVPDDVTDIVIAGMGGEQIRDIIKNSKICYNPELNFIFQPMTRERELRTFLYGNGFFIKEEKLVAENKKIYTVINAAFCGKCKNIGFAFSALGNPERDALFKEKKEREINKYKKIAREMQNNNTYKNQRREILSLIEQLKVY